MTFDKLMRRTKATPEERIACAHFLAESRKRRTIEKLLPERRCFTYCGDAQCTCGIGPNEKTPGG